MSGNSYPSVENDFLIGHAVLIMGSYYNLLRKPILSGGFDENRMAYELFHAPFAVVSHGTESDPVFNYANLTALELFECDWDELTALPSRLSAEPVNRAERGRLLAEVTAKGFIDHYEGIRISKNGRRFRIKNAVVWNLLDSRNIYRGQAACFNEWTFLN